MNQHQQVRSIHNVVLQSRKERAMNQDDEQEFQIVFSFPPFLLRESGLAARKLRGCLAAAERVLHEERKAMHIKALTQQMLSKGFWKSQGRTPQQTVRSAIGRYIKTNGAASCFRKTARNTFALNE